MRVFLTGGAGFLGGYVAEACIDNGHSLRALVQPGTDARLLNRLGAEVITGDLLENYSLAESLRGCDLLIHTAGKVGDWGSWRDFYAANVMGARNLYEAAVQAGVPRAVHVSSTAVYGKDLIQRNAEESQGPIPAEQLPGWYKYGRSKTLSEMLAMEYHRNGQLQMSIVRPGWVYGPRDGARLGMLLNTIRSGRARFLGDGSNTLGLTYVTDVAEAVLMAGTHDAAMGEAFNVSSDEQISQQHYFDGLADLVGAPRVKQSVSIQRAYQIATVMEVTYRMLGIRQRPLITRQAVSLMGLPHRCLNGKIRHQLGWHPRVTFQMALERIHAWWSGIAGEVGTAMNGSHGSRAA